MREMYRGYLIESRPETELVGGPYENNEERQYRPTGKTEYISKAIAKNRKELWHQAESLEAMKTYIDNRLNKRRTESLKKKHERLSREYNELKRDLRFIESALYEVGERFESTLRY